MKNLFLLSVSLIVLSCSSEKSKIYQWRGEDRKGIFAEKNLLKEWTENGPGELWHLEGIGDGYGSPTITENEIFITGAIDSIAILFCFNLNGKLQWKTSLGKEWVVNYPGSRSAPTVVDDLIYLGSGMGDLYCIERN